MPAMSRGKPDPEELPSTLQRSGEKAQRTYAKAHDAAVDTYGEGRRAHQVAFAALKHTHEKVGDHWEPKAHPGPSDDRAAGDRNTPAQTAGGVDAHASKAHLVQIARRLGVPGRGRMTKAELIEAIARANDRQSERARRSDG